MEYKIMSALSGASVPVPKMYLFCEDKTVMGQEFYVMEYIKVQLSTFDYYIAKSEKRALIVNLLIRNFSTSFSRNSKVFLEQTPLETRLFLRRARVICSYLYTEWVIKGLRFFQYCMKQWHKEWPHGRLISKLIWLFLRVVSSQMPTYQASLLTKPGLSLRLQLKL